MNLFFEPTPEAIGALERVTGEIPAIQDLLVANHHQLQVRDRAAHQQQIAGGKVTLTVANQLPPDLAGLGLFQLGGPSYLGIGRISTGLGCPHIQTDPDFLGIMLAFRTSAGQRIDFIGINDPTAPTNTVADFLSLLKTTADAAGKESPFGDVDKLHIGNLIASQGTLLKSLVERAGPIKALQIVGHVSAQTSRTVASSSAVQQYWTGIVRAGNVLGKFTLVPVESVNQHRSVSPGEKYLSEDWRRRQGSGDLKFGLYWIPFLTEAETPLTQLTKAWAEAHRVLAGTVVFPQADAAQKDVKLLALLASEMGANPGNWLEQRSGEPVSEFPATEFTAGRFLAYRNSQQGRNALAPDSYASFITTGEIDENLAAELLRRYRLKVEAGHGVPDVGDL